MINTNDPYLAYYHRQQLQTGSGIDRVFQGANYQRGHGIGSFLGGMFRTIAPLFKSGAKAVGKEALNAGIGFLQDMTSLDNNMSDPKQVANARIRQFTDSLKRRADGKIERLLQGGSGIKKRRTVRKKKTKRTIKMSGGGTKRRATRRRQRRVTPQSLAKLLRVKTSSTKRKKPNSRVGQKKKTTYKKRRQTVVGDIFG